MFSIQIHIIRKIKKVIKKGGIRMFKWAIIFFILAMVAGLLGFGIIANLSYGIAKILFFVFIGLFVISLIFGKRIINKT